MGRGPHPAQNPPPLEGDDAMAWAWFGGNCTGFAKDFGMVPVLIDALGLDEQAREMFVLKLSLIYSTILSIQQKEAENARR